MAKVKVRFKHTCNAPEHPGGVGDVVHVDSKLAESLGRQRRLCCS
jgi:hypothetical protein